MFYTIGTIIITIFIDKKTEAQARVSNLLEVTEPVKGEDEIQLKQSLKSRILALTLYASNFHFDLTVSHRKISSIVTCDAHIVL